MITQKINIQKTDTSKPQLSTASPLAAADKQPVPPPVEKKPAITPEPDASPEVSPLPDKASAPAPIKESEVSPPPEIAYVYIPKGKIDPFRPWFENEIATDAVGAKSKAHVLQTPLEKLDLSQLKLVGIILSPSGNMALVEEPSGKGYVIAKGTYIGSNRGKVAKILKGKVIVEETVSYGLSETSTRRKELKLQKPPGED
ncbi:MAG: pilus assembly protein PilP [Desulfobacterales bacterium]